MTHIRALAMGLCLIVSGCVGSGATQNGDNAGPQGVAKKPVDSTFTMNQMASYVHQVSGLDVAARQNEARRLQASLAMSVSDRLKLAYLLSLEGASLDDIEQARTQLEGLDAVFEDPATRLYVRLLQRTAAMETAYKQEKKRADDLQQKLKQIKELELELMKRNQAQPAESK
jgi:hypothetical protein